MKCTYLNPAHKTEIKDKVFCCPEESQFYSCCTEILLLNSFSPDTVFEFGSGDGISVISAMLRTQFAGFVQGYEINPAACDLAQTHINQSGLGTHYLIFNACFFRNAPGFEKNFLLSNPPYLPYSGKNLILPELSGGPDGTDIIKKLLSLNFRTVMMLVPGISNPLSVFAYAKSSGYRISDFLVTQLPFGYYSSQPEVQQTIRILKEKNMSFFSDAGYLIAGVLFQKKESAHRDRFEEISAIMQSLK